MNLYIVIVIYIVLCDRISHLKVIKIELLDVRNSIR